MTGQPLWRNPRFWLIGFLGVAWSLGIAGSYLPAYLADPGAKIDGVPLLTGADGYFFLRQARDWRDGTYTPVDTMRRPLVPRPHPVPLLSVLTVAASKITGQPLEVVAFYIAPVLAALTAFPLAAFGLAMAGPAGGIVAVMAGGAVPFFLGRSGIGRFDTDCLNIFFLLSAGWFFGRFALGQGWRRLASLALCGATLLAFAMWWFQVAVLGVALMGMAYVASIGFRAPAWERRAKLGILLAGVLGLAALALGLHRYLPRPLFLAGEGAVQQLRMVLHDGESAFPAIGASISELVPIDPALAVSGLSGSIVPIIAAGLGLVILAARREKAALFALLPCGVLAALSLFSQRFYMFAVPLFALGLAGAATAPCLFAPFSRLLPRALRERPGACGALAALAGIALVLPGAYDCVTRHRPTPTYDAGKYLLARSVPQGGEALLWNWWDQGFFLQYVAKTPTIIDGGSQSEDRVVMAATPLATPNPALARNWIRYFAAHEDAGLASLARTIPDPGARIGFLRRVFANPEAAPDLLRANGFDNPEARVGYFFPDPGRAVYLHLTHDLITRNWWWFYGMMGSGLDLATPPSTFVIADAADAVNPRTGAISFGEGDYRLSRLVRVSGTQVATTAFPNPGGHVGIAFAGSRTLYVVDPAVMDSVACRLLFPDGRPMEGFALRAFHPFIGGIWEVR